MDDDQTEAVYVAIEKLPTDIYNISAALIAAGVFIIDQNTGCVVNGFLNLPVIPLTTQCEQKAEVVNRPSLGFKTPCSKTESKTIPPPIEALLYFENNGGIPAGYDPKTKTFHLLLQVLNHNDIKEWTDIAIKVGGAFVIIDADGKPHAQVVISITSAFYPTTDDPEKIEDLRNTVLLHPLLYMCSSSSYIVVNAETVAEESPST